MSVSASRALANALRSTLWLISYYSNMSDPGPALGDLKLAMGRAIVELEAEEALKVNSQLEERESSVKPRLDRFA
jgi:hypothetical protein